MADPGSGSGGPDAASQAAGAAASAAASTSNSGSASTGMSDQFGLHDDSFGQQKYGGPNNLGGLSEDHLRASFNAVNHITEKNPYGKQGFFTRVFGIPPDLLDYTEMGLQSRKAIANNQFSKFANPQNTKGHLGYNPDFDTAPPGQVRSGVQKAGYMTAYGPVMEQAREQSISEMIARGAMGFFGGLPGTVLGQIGTTEYGIPAQAGYQGLPGFDSFDPNDPRPGSGILGAMLGGVNPSQAADKAAQAVDSLRARFSPTLAPTTNAGIGSLTSTVPAMGSVFEVDGRSFLAGKNGPIELSGVSLPNFRSEKPSEATIDKGQGQILGVQDYFQNQFAAPANQFETLNDKMNLGLSDSQLGTPSGIQNTGLFGENPKAAGFQTIGEMIQSVINEENLPDNQNMYGSGTPDLNDILNMYGMETVGQ